MDKFTLSFFLLAALATGALADTICREPDTADFGPAVVSRSDNAFVITKGCAEDNLLVRKPVSLAVHFGQEGDPTGGSQRIERTSAWTVSFELDHTDPDDFARRILDQILPDTMVRVIGFTCSIGSEEYNLGLSRQRAKTVATYLRTRGVSIISTEGRGECCPVSAMDLNKNRRVLIQEVSS